ncbi:MAG: PorV/PorQ family protein [Bacteroidota bacterium]
MTLQKHLYPVGIAVVLFLWSAMALPSAAQLIPAFGNDRAGTSGFQFLKVSVDPRASALGETVAANAFDASALFWNPALAAQTEGAQIGFSHTQYFADVQLQYLAGIVHLERFGLTVGASVQSLNSGEMDVTTEFQQGGTGETFRFIDVATGITVAQQLTDLFSYGVTAKWIHESVAGLTANTGVLDLGVFYRVGDTGAQMAVVIRNFGIDAALQGSLERTVLGDDGTTTETNFESMTPPTTFSLGITYHAIRNHPMNRLMLSGQINNPNDNAENFNLGAEYTWNDVLVLRTGYRFGVEEAELPSVGAGIITPGFGRLRARFDYGFNRLERLGSVHRLGFNLSL